jgi:cell division protein FtsB
MRILIILLVAVLLTLQYMLWVGDGSLAEVWQLQQKLTQQQAENKQLRERNDALRAEVRDLKQGLGAIEERARNEMGMIKKGETYYQVIEGDKK